MKRTRSDDKHASGGNEIESSPRCREQKSSTPPDVFVPVIFPARPATLNALDSDPQLLCATSILSSSYSLVLANQLEEAFNLLLKALQRDAISNELKGMHRREMADAAVEIALQLQDSRRLDECSTFCIGPSKAPKIAELCQGLEIAATRRSESLESIVGKYIELLSKSPRCIFSWRSFALALRVFSSTMDNHPADCKSSSFVVEANYIETAIVLCLQLKDRPVENSSRASSIRAPLPPPLPAVSRTLVAGLNDTQAKFLATYLMTPVQQVFGRAPPAST